MKIIKREEFRELLIKEGLELNNSDSIPCKICNSNSVLFEVVDFNRIINSERYPLGLLGIPIYYYECTNCKFIFNIAFDNFSSFGWKTYIYNQDYFSKMDLAYEENRPTLDAELVLALAIKIGREKIIGLDFGGGNGKLSSILQKKRIKYLSYDPFDFVNTDLIPGAKFNFISSFEVLEHTTNPIGTFQEIVDFGSDKFILCLSTQTSDSLINNSNRLFWSYVAPRNGHVSIYSKKTLTLLGNQFGLKHLPVSRGLHLFSRGIPLGSLKYIAGLIKIKQLIYRKLGVK
jgi:hypothetical protein